MYTNIILNFLFVRTNVLAAAIIYMLRQGDADELKRIKLKLKMKRKFLNISSVIVWQNNNEPVTKNKLFCYLLNTNTSLWHVFSNIWPWYDEYVSNPIIWL